MPETGPNRSRYGIVKNIGKGGMGRSFEPRIGSAEGM